MPVQMLGRPIIKKQTGYSLYRPAAIAIANTLADIPFSAVRILIYNIIIYFMSGLKRSAGGFFTYHLFVREFHLAAWTKLEERNCADVLDLPDDARFLPDVRFHVHELRLGLPFANVLLA